MTAKSETWNNKGRDDEVILQVTGLTKHFRRRGGLAFWREPGVVKAVDGVSLSITQGQTFGLVGESGCGKSTTGRLILRVLRPTRGKVVFMGRDVGGLKGRDLADFRRKIQAVYQDPYASLNPRMRVDRIIAEPMATHRFLSRRERGKRVGELLERVGLSGDQARRHPHEFSGGQRQRIGIARALALNPRFIVLDEPVSALDVSIRAQILNLLARLQEDFRLTYLFVSHDLSVVEHFCDRVAVMYLGRVVESAGSRELFSNPAHPYTRALLSAVPVADPDHRVKAVPITGEIPSPINPPPGCHFHPRCPEARDECRNLEPPARLVEPGHVVHCHLHRPEPDR